MMCEECEKGFFISFDFSSDALTEIDAIFKRTHEAILALTVQEILDGQVAKKLVPGNTPYQSPAQHVS